MPNFLQICLTATKLWAADRIWVYIHSNFRGGLRATHFKTWCVMAVQGHSRSLILAPSKAHMRLLLVINSNVGPVLHCFWDKLTVTYWSKNANFPHSLSFNALSRGEPFRIYMNLIMSRLELLGYPSVKNMWFYDSSLRRFDTVAAWQTDRRTTRQR